MSFPYEKLNTINECIRLMMNKKRHFIKVKPDKLITFCNKREEVLKNYTSVRNRTAKFCLKMIYWNSKLIQLIELNKTLREEDLPIPLKKLLLEINEKIVDELNKCLSPHLNITIEEIIDRHFRKCHDCQEQIRGQNFLSHRPKNFWPIPFSSKLIKRNIEYTIRTFIGNRNGFPSLKLLAIFAQYQKILGPTGEYTFSDNIDPEVLQAFDAANHIDCIN